MREGQGQGQGSGAVDEGGETGANTLAGLGAVGAGLGLGAASPQRLGPSIDTRTSGAAAGAHLGGGEKPLGIASGAAGATDPGAARVTPGLVVRAALASGDKAGAGGDAHLGIERLEDASGVRGSVAARDPLLVALSQAPGCSVLL